MKQFSVLLLITFLFLSCFSTDNDDEEKDTGNTLVDSATTYTDIISFSPQHDEENVSKSTTITIQFSNEITFTNSIVSVDLFGVDNSKDNPRFSHHGLLIGDLSFIDSQYELYGYVSADSNNGLEVYGEVVYGEAIVNTNNSLTITPERELIEGITYVVHIFCNDAQNFTVWWRFKT